MASTVSVAAGGFRFVPGVFQYSAGVAAEPVAALVSRSGVGGPNVLSNKATVARAWQSHPEVVTRFSGFPTRRPPHDSRYNPRP